MLIFPVNFKEKRRTHERGLLVHREPFILLRGRFGHLADLNSWMSLVYSSSLTFLVSSMIEGVNQMNGLGQFIQEHFAHVAPILAAGAIALVITFERLVALMWSYPLERPRAFYDKIRNLVLNERISEAVAYCERHRTKPAANIVREGLLRAHQPESVIAHGLEIAVGEAHEKIGARTAFLATIANVATLLGLFGTIMGLIQSFDAVDRDERHDAWSCGRHSLHDHLQLPHQSNQQVKCRGRARSGTSDGFHQTALLRGWTSR
jgi:hypothetical protein